MGNMDKITSYIIHITQKTLMITLLYIHHNPQHNLIQYRSTLNLKFKPKSPIKFKNNKAYIFTSHKPNAKISQKHTTKSKLKDQNI